MLFYFIYELPVFWIVFLVIIFPIGQPVIWNEALNFRMVKKMTSDENIAVSSFG